MFNWKKVLLFTVAAPVVASLNNVLVGNASGVHIPFTLGTVLAPAVPIAIKGLVALFSQPPQNPPVQ